MNHPYFIAQMKVIFNFLVLMLVVDISILQSFVQLIICFFLLLLQFMWVFEKGKFKNNANFSNLTGGITCIKWLLMLQTLLIYVFNIKVNIDILSQDL